MFRRELEALAAAARHSITIRWLDLAPRERQPAALREALHTAIVSADPAEVDAVPPGYGLWN